MPQNYQNHRCYYIPHHFIFYPVILALTIYSFYRSSQADHHTEAACLWAALGVVFVLLGWVSYMMRQHYALNNQNRIVRLEMKLRYYQLTQQRFETIEHQLTFGQIAALRFASDAELPALVQRTLAEKLSPNEIKKAIQQWQPDSMRV